MAYQPHPDRSVTRATVGETLAVVSLFGGAVLLMSAGSFLPAKLGDVSSRQRQLGNERTMLLPPPTSLSAAEGGHSSEDTHPLGI